MVLFGTFVMCLVARADERLPCLAQSDIAERNCDDDRHYRRQAGRGHEGSRWPDAVHDHDRGDDPHDAALRPVLSATGKVPACEPVPVRPVSGDQRAARRGRMAAGAGWPWDDESERRLLWRTLPRWFEPAVLAKVVPGVAFFVALYLIMKLCPRWNGAVVISCWRRARHRAVSPESCSCSACLLDEARADRRAGDGARCRCGPRSHSAI